ncbi:MAG: hypothetical protein L3J09_04225 [Flavobacteriaceae bacterium]|nr:hypothetical protein [Flavobacteriaceae bacterium]
METYRYMPSTLLSLKLSKLFNQKNSPTLASGVA